MSIEGGSQTSFGHQKRVCNDDCAAINVRNTGLARKLSETTVPPAFRSSKRNGAWRGLGVTKPNFTVNRHRRGARQKGTCLRSGLERGAHDFECVLRPKVPKPTSGGIDCFATPYCTSNLSWVRTQSGTFGDPFCHDCSSGRTRHSGRGWEPSATTPIKC